MERGEETIRKIRDAGVTTGTASVMRLELKSLKSVQVFAAAFNAEHKYLNLLVNNGKGAASTEKEKYTNSRHLYASSERYNSENKMNERHNVVSTYTTPCTRRTITNKYSCSPAGVSRVHCAHF